MPPFNHRNPPSPAGRILFRVLLIAGFVLPWLVGVGVKLYLDATGQPTFPWSFFLSLEAIIFQILLTLWWGAPFFLLAIASRLILDAPFFIGLSRTERLIVLVSGTLGAVYGALDTYITIFLSFDTFLEVAFLTLGTYVVGVPLSFLPHLLIGVVLGALIVLTGVVVRRSIHGKKPTAATHI